LAPTAPVLSVSQQFGQAFLSWTNSAAATYYKIKKSSGDISGPYSTLFTTPNANQTTYTDPGAVGTTLFYVVGAVNGYAEVNSNPVQITLSPVSPQLTGAGPGSAAGSVDLKWTPITDSTGNIVTTYNIYYSTDPNFANPPPTVLTVTPVMDAKLQIALYTVTGLIHQTPPDSYYFAVSGLVPGPKGTVESPLSKEMPANPN
jgi:hypothetical protein